MSDDGPGFANISKIRIVKPVKERYYVRGFVLHVLIPIWDSLM